MARQFTPLCSSNSITLAAAAAVAAILALMSIELFAMASKATSFRN
jgi:hypothetical protein